jgi:hypothetical protein
MVLGMTQSNIATALGTTRAYVSAVEQGVDWNPDADKLAVWARALGWEDDHLLRKLNRMALPSIEAASGLTPALIQALGRAVAEGVRLGVADALRDLQGGGKGPLPPPAE